MSNAVVAKPKKVSAPIYWAPAGTTCPTDATTEMSTFTAFKSLGSVSEDGFKENTEREIETIKRWGGDVALTVQKGKTDTFTFTLIDYLNEERLKLTNGASNVSGTLSTGMTIVSDNDELGSHAFVIDEILTGGVLQRTVIPEASITSTGEIEHKDDGVLSQDITLTAVADADGKTFTRYIINS